MLSTANLLVQVITKEQYPPKSGGIKKCTRCAFHMAFQNSNLYDGARRVSVGCTQRIVKTFPEVFHMAIDFLWKIRVSPFFLARWNSALHGNQAVGIVLSSSIELTDSAAGSLSLCTIKGPLQFSKGPIFFPQ